MSMVAESQEAYNVPTVIADLERSAEADAAN